MGVGTGRYSTFSYVQNLSYNSNSFALRAQPDNMNKGSDLINSILEQSEDFSNKNLFMDWFSCIIRIIDDISSRISSAGINSTGTYNILFMQYNLMVYIMLICILGILFGMLVLSVSIPLKKNTEYLSHRFPKTIGKFASSRYLDIIILFNQLGIMFTFFVLIKCVLFLYYNHIPADLGVMCDTIL